MAVPRPTHEEIRAAAAELGIELTGAACDFYLSFMDPDLEAYEILQTLPVPGPDDRDRSWWRPAAQDDPLGAWQARTEIRTRDQGRLAGRTVALNDNISLAGVPMAVGTALLADYVADVDAEVARRLLDAGATITGKSQCEYLALANGSHTCAAGPVRNPHRPTHSSGGASSGAAALVASGAVDVAVGTDASGSIRVPAGWSGAVGLKPTHGLVPYDGILPLEPTLEDAGPITATVADNALLLEVLAGADEGHYTGSLAGGCADVRVGVVQEAFEVPGLDPEVIEATRSAAAILAALGARVEDVKVPGHALGMAVWDVIALEGHVAQLLAGGLGTGRRGSYLTGLAEALRGWQAQAEEFPLPVKVAMVVGNTLRRCYGGATYAKAQNLLGVLAEAYDAALADFDVLMMPTTTTKATELPTDRTPPELGVRQSFEMAFNTVSCNASGHPAITVPCGLRDGLPLGAMFIARRFAEPMLYRVAHAFEQSADWRSL